MAKKELRTEFAYPSDLAVLVKRRLGELGYRSPSQSVLHALFEAAFFASMRTEEGEPIRCALTYISDKNPDPSPPQRIRADRWSVSRFGQGIELNVKSLVKLAKSVDPKAGSLAVYADRDGILKIWGVIDQRGGRVAFATAESDVGGEPPGMLEAVIAGLGTIEVYHGYTLLAALRQGHLGYGAQDVLEEGPISRAFRGEISKLIEDVSAEVGFEIYGEREHWDDSVAHYWTTALIRILLGVQQYGHGGAILITPDDDNTGLRIKYPNPYGRLATAVKNFAAWTIRRTHAEDEIHEDYIDKDADHVPTILHLDELIFSDEEEDTADEITGCVRLIASMSRVDGLVVMSPGLSVRGYGGIITVESEPPGVWLATEPFGRRQTSVKIRGSHFGTRHQSMMRMCYARPDSVGFVISQDGDVRAITRVGNSVVIWEDVKLRRI